MSFSWLNNPHNLWGNWVNSQFHRKAIILSSIILSIFALPLLNYFSLSGRLDEQQHLLQQQEKQTEHQQKLLATLKQQSQSKISTSMAKQLPQINAQVQQLAKGLSIEHAQWSFQHNPLLTLQVKGHFPELRVFLAELFQQNKEIKLLTWQISQLNESERSETQSILSRIQLQLVKEK